MVRSSLSGLLASLVIGCGPQVGSGDNGSDTGNGGQDGPSSAGSASTSNTGATTASTGATSTSTSGDADSDDDGNDGSAIWDHQCPDRVYVDTLEIPLSLIERLLFEGEVPDFRCQTACEAAGIDGFVVSCSLDDAPPGSSSSDSSTSASGGSSGDHAESSSDTGDGPTVLLTCTWMGACGIGRGHAALRPTAPPRGSDPIARWAARTAYAEAASVGAFLALHGELAEHGAPSELLARTRAAARDEIRHARTIGRLAAERGVAAPAPRFMRAPVRGLEAIAIENAVEGCVRETWSAIEALVQARDADTDELRGIMARIATDETRHAELAHDLACWLDTRLDEQARVRVRAARDAAVEALFEHLRREQPAHRALGLPDARVACTLAEGLRTALWS